MRKRRVKRAIHSSSLRHKLEERLKERENENPFGETYDYEDKQSPPPKPFLLNLIVQMHRHLLVKITVIVIIVFAISFLSTLDSPFVQRLSDKIYFITTWHMDIEYLIDEFVPVINQLWEGSKDNQLTAPPAENGLALPLDGEIISPYGVRLGKTGNRQEMHYGIDIGFTGEEASVNAILDGKVADIEEDPVLGLTVYIDHDHQMSSLYGRLTQALVSPGDLVYSGQQIGVIRGGNSDVPPYLHFEIRQNGRPVDPLTLIGDISFEEKEAPDEDR